MNSNENEDQNKGRESHRGKLQTRSIKLDKKVVLGNLNGSNAEKEKSIETIVAELITELKRVNAVSKSYSISPVKGGEDKRKLTAKFNLFLSHGLNIVLNNEDNVKEKSYNHKENSKVVVQEKRNDSLIFQLLKQLPIFKRYLKYNMISDESLKESIPYLKYKYVEKGCYLYDETNEGQHFYGLLKGEVSIRNRRKRLTLPLLRKKTQNLNMNLRLTNIFSHDPRLEQIYEGFDSLQGEEKQKSEEELMNYIFKAVKINLGKVWLRKLNLEDYDKQDENATVIKQAGECFGEWDILNNKLNKTSSAIAVVNSHIFYLDKVDFMNTISRCVLRADNERKEFIKTCVKTFRSYMKFDTLYEKITTHFCEKGDVIYHENTPGRNFYLILHGGCVLQKFIPNSSEIKYNYLNYEIGSGKIIDVLKLERGGLVGLDSIFDLGNKKSSTYKFTLKANQKYTALLKISYDDLNATNSRETKDFLFELYKNQMKMLNKTCQNYRTLMANMRPAYKKIKIVKSSDDFKYDARKVDDFMKAQIKNENKTKSYNNDFKVGKVKISSKSCVEIKLDEDLNKKNEGNINKKLTFNLISSENVLKNAKSSLNINLNLNLNPKLKSNRNLSVVAPEHLTSHRRETKKRNSHNFLVNQSDPLYITQNPFYSLQAQNKKPQLEHYVRNSIRRSTVKRESLFSGDMKKLICLKKKVKEEPCNIRETIKRSASEWKLAKSRNNSFYKSGMFNLPLLSSIMSKNASGEG